MNGTSAAAAMGNYGSNYALYRWDGLNWQLIDSHCDYACHPVPPAHPGNYVGEVLIVTCQPSLA